MIDGKSGAPFARTPEFNNRSLLRHAIAAAVAAGALIAVSAADARIVSVQTSAPTVAFGGFNFPGVGQYVKITGVAYAEVDPADPRNANIVDINLAAPQPAGLVNGLPQPGMTATGKVGYLLNFYILKPASLAAVNTSLNGYGKMMYEPPNRGGKTWTALGRVTGGGDDPASITNTTVLANSFLMSRGYTLVWSGWEMLGNTANTIGTTTDQAVVLPLAKGAGGATITGPAYEYATSATINLNYPAASLDKTQATLTHRVHINDVAEVVPTANWQYNAAGTQISPLGAGTSVSQDIYEFRYTAKDPTVAGLGFAAVRDFNSWIKYGTAAEGNPLAGYIQRIYTEISSQPGRMLNDFRTLGFNEDDSGAPGSGRKVLDGIMNWISAGSGIGMNYRFSQSNRTERNRQDHLYMENLFPFANVPTTDPFTGVTANRYGKCQLSNTCPLGVEIYSANEYWVKTASLLHTQPNGSADLPESPFSRNYFISSMQHGTGNAANRGNCQQPGNPLSSNPVQRALWLALDKWSTQNVPAPPSMVPRLDNGTLVLPANTGFPTNIPDPFGETANGKVTYTGLKSPRYRYPVGDSFYTSGIPANFPTYTPPYEINVATPTMTINGPLYPSFAPATDSDGNDIAGVRLPDVTVPIATYTGWSYRRAAQANDGCEAAGQFIPFAATAVARAASGDPRPAVAERYPTFDTYDVQVKSAITAMIKQRTMLCEDSATELQRMRTLGATRGVPNAPATFPAYSFALGVSTAAATPASLAANGNLQPVTLSTSGPDTCNVSCGITAIAGTGGATSADWTFTPGTMTASLRGTAGRIYKIAMSCTDPANPTASPANKVLTVSVPNPG